MLCSDPKSQIYAEHVLIRSLIKLLSISLSLFTFGISNAQSPPQYEWDLSDIYPDLGSWQSAMAEISSSIENLVEFKGTLGDSSQAMLSALSVYSNVNKEVARAYVYTSLERDADQREPEAQARFGLSRQMFSNLSEAVSWINPEILAIGENRINQFLIAEPALADFEFIIRDILRQEPHTLDESTETILAQAGMVLSSPSQIYQNYANADIPWPTICLLYTSPSPRDKRQSRMPSSA